MKFWLQFKFWLNFAKQQNKWIWIATVLSRGGALPPEQSRYVRHRHAPGHAAAWLRAPAVMWTSPSVLIHSPAASTARPPRFSLLCPTPTTRPRLQFHRTQSLSSQIEHSTTFATPLRTQRTPISFSNPPSRQNFSVLPQHRPRPPP